MKKTIFYDTHVRLGAKMAPFGGYDMPIQYEGIVKEHQNTRTNTALFDTCHMGEFLIEGTNACTDLDHILSCNVAPLKIGQCKYGFICNPQGGVIDDQVIYRLTETSFFMVVNASTQDNDFNWISTHVSPGTTVKNLSAETAKIDIQGPGSVAIVNKLLDKPVNDLKYYHFMHNRYKGLDIIISRTGYTGEIGFELYCDEPRAFAFWDSSMELGAKPAGLGARDTLRLEMGFPLYGHELDDKRNAAESQFVKAIAVNKEFIGSDVVNNPNAIKQMLAGIVLEGRRAARNNDSILNRNGEQAGIITSGSFSPSLQQAIALAYINKDLCAVGTKVTIRTERNDLAGTVCEVPFYKQATARRPIADFLS
jgi:aminomethyltransferase